MSFVHFIFSVTLNLQIRTFSSHTEYVKRESIVIARLKISLLLINDHVLYVLEHKTSTNKIPPVCLFLCLSVCMSVCLAVRTYIDSGCRQ